jgi:hypothetical protein
MLTVESDSNLSEDTDFLECIRWTSRAVEDSDNDNDELTSNETMLPDRLANCAVAFNVSHAALSDLLCILQPLTPYLLKDARTLFQTCREVQPVSLAGGDCYYFGVGF